MYLCIVNNKHKQQKQRKMKTQLKKVMSGRFCSHKLQIIDQNGNKWDLSSVYVQQKSHHSIIETEDGSKLALNHYNGICYRIIGEKYN